VIVSGQCYNCCFYRVGEECSASAASILEGCINVDPKLRPTAREIVSTLEQDVIWPGPSRGAVGQSSEAADTEPDKLCKWSGTQGHLGVATPLSMSQGSSGATTVLDRLLEGRTLSSAGGVSWASDLWTRGIPPADVDIQMDRSGQPAVLGRGAYAVVYLGRWRATQVAVKVLLVSDAAAHRQVRAEADILITLRHPNVVMLMAVCISPRQPVKHQPLQHVSFPVLLLVNIDSRHAVRQT
jgi:serine/threonine protein kinase